MLGRRKATLINLGFKYSQLFLSIITGIVLIPVYLHYISVSEYGAWLACSSVVIWLTVVDPGMSNILMQKIGVAFGGGRTHAINSFLTVGLSVSLCAGVVVAFLGIIFSDSIVSVLGFDHGNKVLTYATALLSLSAGLMLLGYALAAASYGLQNVVGPGVAFLVATVAKIIVILVLLSEDYGILALAYGEVVAAAVVVAGGGLSLWKHLRRLNLVFKPSFDQSSEFLGLLSISFGARFSKTLARGLDNVFVARIIGPEAVVVFSLTSKVPKQAENVLGLSFSALRPSVANVAGKSNIQLSRQISKRLIRISLWAAALGAALLSVFNSKFVNLWVGPEFFGGHSLNQFLVVLFFVRVWNGLFNALGFSFGEIRRNSRLEWVTSIVLVPVLWVGISTYGLAGLVGAHVLVALGLGAWYFPKSLDIVLTFDRKDYMDIIRTFASSVLSGLILVLFFFWVQVRDWLELGFFVTSLSGCYLFLLYYIDPNFRLEAGTVLLSLKKYWKSSNDR